MTRLRRSLREFGITPYDSNSGAGYGVGVSSGRFSPRGAADGYPYGSESDLEGDEEEDEDLDDEAFEKRQAYGATDALQQRNQACDRSSFIGNATRLYMALFRPGDLLGEDIFTPDARSGPNTPKLAAGTRGWSGAPRGSIADENEFEPLSLRDVFDAYDDEEYPVDRQNRKIRRLRAVSK